MSVTHERTHQTMLLAAKAIALLALVLAATGCGSPTGPTEVQAPAHTGGRRDGHGPRAGPRHGDLGRGRGHPLGLAGLLQRGVSRVNDLERDRIHARDRAAFMAKRKRDYDLIRAKHQFGDGPPPPPDPEPDKPTKMPVAI